MSLDQNVNGPKCRWTEVSRVKNIGPICLGPKYHWADNVSKSWTEVSIFLGRSVWAEMSNFWVEVSLGRNV
jgi:hypothetical protein